MLVLRALCEFALLIAGAVDGGPAHRPSGHGCPPGSGGRGGAGVGLLEEPVRCGGQQGEQNVLLHYACSPGARLL